MEENKVKFNVKMLAAYMGQSIKELAKNSGINPNHLCDVSSGRVKMTADDLGKLAKYTGVSVYDIAY